MMLFSHRSDLGEMEDVSCSFSYIFVVSARALLVK